MAKKKRTNGQKTIYKTWHIKLKIELNYGKKCYDWTKKYYARTKKCYDWTKKYYDWTKKYYAWTKKCYYWTKKYYDWTKKYYAWTKMLTMGYQTKRLVTSSTKTRLNFFYILVYIYVYLLWFTLCHICWVCRYLCLLIFNRNKSIYL